MGRWDGYSAFWRLFEYSHHIRLLSATEAESVTEVRAALADGGADQVLTMLRKPNWRPQLVGAVAVLVQGQASAEAVEALWHACDAGSWVSPQLAATLSLVDPAFLAEAKRRILARCQIGDDLARMPWHERHGAQGPGSVDEHSAKLLSALLVLVERAGESESVVGQRRELGDRFVELDVDHGGAIAEEWRGNIQATLRAEVRP